MDFDPIDHPALQTALVVDEHQRIEGAGAEQRRGQACACLTGAINGDPGDRRLDVAGEQVVAHHDPRARHVQQHQAGVDDHHAPGECSDVQSLPEEAEEHSAQCHGKRHGEHRLVPEKANNGSIQA
jgi:hypothetical protein